MNLLILHPVLPMILILKLLSLLIVALFNNLIKNKSLLLTLLNLTSTMIIILIHPFKHNYIHPILLSHRPAPPPHRTRNVIIPSSLSLTYAIIIILIHLFLHNFSHLILRYPISTKVISLLKI